MHILKRLHSLVMYSLLAGRLDHTRRYQDDNLGRVHPGIEPWFAEPTRPLYGHLFGKRNGAL